VALGLLHLGKHEIGTENCRGRKPARSRTSLSLSARNQTDSSVLQQSCLVPLPLLEKSTLGNSYLRYFACFSVSGFERV